MSLTGAQVHEAAMRLHEAERARTQVKSTSLVYPDMDIDDAYAVQHAWVEHKISLGRHVRGRKIGLTSRAMQAAMQIDEPDFGTLLDDMFFDDGSEIEAAQFCDPRIEMELAFVMARPLSGEGVTLLDVLSATDYVIPAVEIIAARTHRIDPDSGQPRNVLDTISDNAANAGIVMGGRPVRPMDVDLRWVGGLLYRNGVLEETGVAAGVLNHPANGVAWLARRFGPLGVNIERGHVVLAGSFTRPVPIRAGDTFHADFGTLGSLSCRFA